MTWVPADIKNLTKQPAPDLPFGEIKNAVVGPDYELSLVFASANLTHKLNLAYRGKDKAANVLSFPLSPNSGEIFLTLSAKVRDEEILSLFIHGLLHLKGFDHGSIMDDKEEKIRKKFSLTNNVENRRNRNRRGDISRAGGGVRVRER
jgi:probable rRNA maturation factor